MFSNKRLNKLSDLDQDVQTPEQINAISVGKRHNTDVCPQGGRCLWGYTHKR